MSKFAVNHIPGADYTYRCPSVPEKPCVIVANHQSHLDLMALLSISPDIVVLTNRWVQHFPFYAPLVRYADFLPVEGLASGNGFSSLKRLVADGYSVAVFPEGTRSEDGRIGRFHKGAFAIADALNLSVLPVVLHGFSDVLPKADLLLRKGSLSMTMLSPVTVSQIKALTSDNALGILLLTRKVRQLMTDGLEKVRREEENPSYFIEKVAALYLYRGGKLYSDVRKFLKETALYSSIIDTLPYEGEAMITDTHSGELTLLAAYSRPGLKIVPTVSRECREILLNLAELPENIILVQE